MKVLYVDCSLTGISGDMLLSALLNLGAELDLRRLSESVKRSLEGVKQLNLSYSTVLKMGFQAGFLKVEISDTKLHRKGVDVRNGLKETMDLMGAGREARRFASNVLETLLNAESRIHGKPAEEVHLHEVGSPDTLVDIAGVALALESLDMFKGVKVYGSPVAVGSGAFKTRHGHLVSPAPATLEILRSKGYPFKGGPVEGELATPTGVAILVNLVDEPVYMLPLIKPLKVAYGAGLRDLPDMPNVIRLIYGETPPSYISEDIYVLETNLDDVQGEVLGYVLEKLMEDGARDACIIPVTAKKSRPGYILKVIADGEKLSSIVERIFSETGTLGIRVLKTPRFVVSREIKSLSFNLKGIRFSVKVKVARDLEGRVIRVKPEYEDLRRVSKLTEIPIRELSTIIHEKAKRALKQP